VGDDSTNFEIDDPGGGVRIAGIAGSPGAAASAVLTADGDGGTSWEAGAGQPVNASLRANGVGHNDAANIIGSGNGNIFANVGGVSVAGAMGLVANLGNLGYVLGGMVPETADAFVITVSVNVTDATGVNTASAQGGFTVPSPVTDLTSLGTLAGGDWSVDSGTDLTIDGDDLSSTAGGAFFVSVQVTGSWD
jgi:hypothetical protein